MSFRTIVTEASYERLKRLPRERTLKGKDLSIKSERWQLGRSVFLLKRRVTGRGHRWQESLFRAVNNMAGLLSCAGYVVPVISSRKRLFAIFDH